MVSSISGDILSESIMLVVKTCGALLILGGRQLKKCQGTSRFEISCYEPRSIDYGRLLLYSMD
jgi:hypothetical protein